MQASVGCSDWLEAVMLLIGPSTIHEDAVFVPAKTTEASGAIVFNRDLVLLFLPHDECVALHPLKIEVGGQLSRVFGPDQLAVRRDRQPAEHWVATELDPRFFGISNVKGKPHGHPPFGTTLLAALLTC